MYKLTLTAEGYNRISFMFEDLLSLTNFLMTAMRNSEGELEAKITLEEKECEGKCSSEN